MFTRRIKSCLKKDSQLASSNFCIKLLSAPFSSCLRNNSRTHFFLFFLFFFFILSKTTSCKNKMSFPSESDMMSKELQNSDLIYVNLMTDVFKIIVKYCWRIITKYCHLLPSGNRAYEIHGVSNDWFCFVPETMRYLFGVQWGQSYLMGRR